MAQFWKSIVYPEYVYLSLRRASWRFGVWIGFDM